jgi:hypothetical protein
VHHLQTGRVQEHFLRQMHGAEHAGRRAEFREIASECVLNL